MAHVVNLPPDNGFEADGSKAGGWWHSADQEGHVICDLCPRACNMKPGVRGFCFVRENRGGKMVLTTYGESTGFCIDPIEKKPLNHFFPGTSVLSFGTAGCNLGCLFCQNWSISKSREVEMLSEQAAPETIAEAARKLGCRSVAFTYNDPVIWAEYAIDVAKACRALGIKTVAVTAGYITFAARGPFFEAMDAANVDLKAFTEQFYHQLTLSHLDPVLDTLRWLKAETDVWFEITNLVIPQANDSADELRNLSEWVLDNLGDEVPVHFSAFHPDFHMRTRGPTPHNALLTAYNIARRTGLKYVYVGNVHDSKRNSTYCPHCDEVVIERDWYDLGQYRLKGNHCGNCGGSVAGRFEEVAGTWGNKRLPVRIADFSAPPADTNPSEKIQKMPVTTNPGNGTDKSPSEPPVFTKEQERAIHRAACEFIAAPVTRHPVRPEDAGLGSDDQVRRPESAMALSLEALSTESSVLVSAVPRPQPGPKIRPPAVAGAFYPGDVEELSTMVDRLLADTGDGKGSWPAVMVPHAGLIYSGKLAARVFNRIKIPETVIVLGPKHRPMGMEWAVAPHETWSLPGSSVASDPELARQLADAIPDLHLDAQAHQQEHCIEVQLPLLARLAPRSRVVGIVLGAADLERCREFATGLAKVLRKRKDKPLLVISSDMNHYASDTETRQLDEIALTALDGLDPSELYETTRKQKINMCGMLPAVIVLETLRQLKILKKCWRVGYATSAETSGDKSRVVGYASVLFG